MTNQSRQCRHMNSIRCLAGWPLHLASTLQLATSFMMQALDTRPFMQGEWLGDESCEASSLPDSLSSTCELKRGSHVAAEAIKNGEAPPH